MSAAVQLLILLVLVAPLAIAGDDEVARQHCGPEAFSPRYEHCERFQTVPEPSTLWLALPALAVLAWRRRRG